MSARALTVPFCSLPSADYPSFKMCESCTGEISPFVTLMGVTLERYKGRGAKPSAQGSHLSLLYTLLTYVYISAHTQR